MGVSQIIVAQPYPPVETLPGDVEVAQMAGGVLDHVEHDELHIGDLLLVPLACRPTGGVDKGVNLSVRFAVATAAR
jgi:hypothetical protein